MSRLLDGMPYTPSVATDIRKTFARVDAEADWRSRLEGAKQVMKTLSGRENVTPITSRKRK